MRYHMLKAGLLSGFLLFSTTAAAATCRAGSAAEAGSQAGYERAGRPQQPGTTRKQCLILPAVLSVPYQERQSEPAAIPGLDDIISQLENKVCEAALDKVNEQIPDNIDPEKLQLLKPMTKLTQPAPCKGGPPPLRRIH
uniref:conjugal transfer protein n=1 Tax=Citrobacter portucalensis TaxID=1639133 RepID=UPI00220CC3F9|nr:IncI1 plasmid conjugative transfer protein TraL [Citrobacter portucalensis]